MTETQWVYLNGDFVPAADARISPFDRGFLFAQAAYEVTAVYNGQLIDFEAHLSRLKATLEGIEICLPEQDLTVLHHELIRRNQLTEGLIYLQVSAGDQGWRDFAGPERLAPSVFAFVTHRKLIGDEAEKGLRAVCVEDQRWSRRDLKTTQLLSQSLAYRQARRQGAQTAILHEQGQVTEAASANLWIVTDSGCLMTRDLSHALLPGITRARIRQLLESTGLSFIESAFSLQTLACAKEVFTSSTGVVIAPVTHIDDRPVGTGRPGPVVRQVQRLYYEFIGADISTLNWLTEPA